MRFSAPIKRTLCLLFAGILIIALLLCPSICLADESEIPPPGYLELHAPDVTKAWISNEERESLSFEDLDKPIALNPGKYKICALRLKDEFYVYMKEEFTIHPDECTSLSKKIELHGELDTDRIDNGLMMISYSVKDEKGNECMGLVNQPGFEIYMCGIKIGSGQFEKH